MCVCVCVCIDALGRGRQGPGSTGADQGQIAAHVQCVDSTVTSALEGCARCIFINAPCLVRAHIL